MSKSSINNPLVAVLAIVIILGTVYFTLFFCPTCTSRKAALKSSCQHNMSKLGKAFHLYCADYDNTLPSSALRGSKTWDDQEFSKFATLQGGSGISTTLVSLLTPYFDFPPKLGLWCPSDPTYPPTGDFHLATASYWYKAANDKAWFDSIRKLDDYQWTADQILMYEHTSWHWGEPDKGLSNGASINCVFMDGHVATKRIVNAGNAPGKSSPLAPGEPAWYNHDFAKDVSLGKGSFYNPKTQGDNLN